MKTNSQTINELWTDIYYLLRYDHQEKITHQQVRVLQAIEKEDEVGIKDIANIIHTSHNTASEHVKRLIEKGYIYKSRSNIDERKVLLYLTELGSAVLHKHSSLDEEALDHILQSLKPDEAKLLLTALSLLKERANDVRSR